MPNIELTQAESNIIYYLIDSVVCDADARVSRLIAELDRNGSLDGVYGENFKKVDEQILAAAKAAIPLYEGLRDRFPFDENVEA